MAVAAVTEFVLSQAGCEVTVAGDGAAAWGQLNAGNFAMVVSDEQMPHLTGLELRHRMLCQGRLREIPFILVTAKRWELDERKSIDELAITRLVQKPYSPIKLAEIVGQTIAGSRTR